MNQTHTPEHFFIKILTTDEKNQIDEMVDIRKKDNTQELEVSFRKINYPDYIRIVEYYVNNIDENKITTKDSLDISILLADKNTYRISLNDKDLINKFIGQYSKSSPTDIQKYLLSLNPSDEIDIIFKNRGSGKRLYIDDFDMVFKITQELSLDKKNGLDKPKLTGTEKMLYRYKQRVSFGLNKHFQLDTTEVQESSSLWNLADSKSSYEIEIEALDNKSNVNSLFAEVINTLKVIQDTTYPIGKKEAHNVVYLYKNLLNIKTHITTPVNRKVVSIEQQHIVNFIPNRYGVTDKVDGTRYMLVSISDGIYLISLSMNVKKTSLVADNVIYQNMVLDGEVVKDSTTGKTIYLVYDVVYANGIDYQHDTNFGLKQRRNVVYEIIDKCFHNIVPFTEYTDKHKNLELASVEKFYVNELDTYWKKFNSSLAKTDTIFITRKIYLIPYGIDPCEIFMYANIIWKLSVYKDLLPYTLDGIIYTPLNSPYLIKTGSTNLDTIPQEYKWKPPKQNSIDFYIMFEKDRATRADAIFFDESVKNGVGTQYKVCRLFCHIQKGMNEVPVPFKINGVEQKAIIYITDGEIRDIEGHVIDDSTVVEFIFDTSLFDVDDSYKWIPLRTRYDKTESVTRFHTMYGNHIATANRIWKTIVNPITEEHIAALANPNTYPIEMDKFAKGIKTGAVYYEEKDKPISALGMSAFHNWIKTNMISTYAKDKRNLLDIGMGRGGDLQKVISAGVKEYVGLDVDNAGLYTINDCALVRYKKFKKTMKNVPPMHFINANAKGLFNVTSQMKLIPNMNNTNKNMIDEYLSGHAKYSVINCQFSLHYYLSDEISWSNFCKNISDHIEDNGYLLITCFDGKLLHDKLMGKKSIKITITGNNGIKNTFFEIRKMYSDEDPVGLGLGIDVYNSIISTSNTYITEYLVDPDFLKQSLQEKCGLTLVDSDSFHNIFNLYKNYFTLPCQPKGSSYLEGDTNTRHDTISKYYMSLDPKNKALFTMEEIDSNTAGYKLSSLNRYYVFRKTVNTKNLSEPSRIVGINYRLDLGKFLIPYFGSNNLYIDPANKCGKINDVYHAIRRMHQTIRPNVYLIRHNILEHQLRDQIFQNNQFDVVRIKEGLDPKILLIYKSPEHAFYPIYYRGLKNDMYLFNSDKLVTDLNILTALTNRTNNIND